ncbi:MAG: Crp/Fnr family transcriptional regulator [Bacteroides sp.]|nr:Crp/Fnr family transcriptional regulator [Bacteroides sp.]
MEIDRIIHTIYPLPENSLNKLKAEIFEEIYRKGDILFKAHRIEQNIYFIKKGIVRAYTETGDNEVTFWFGKEGNPLISMQSYILRKSGYEDIELLEDCIVYKLNSHYLQQLYNEDIYIANWGRRFAEQELIKAEKRFITRQFKTATERYKDLLKESPELLQRVQLGYIASYLGITQVSLSRIRAEIR